MGRAVLHSKHSLSDNCNCYKHKKDYENQEKYLYLAILEANTIREPYFELAVFYFEKQEYLKSAVLFNEMLKIKNRELNYMSSPACWGSLPYDYLSMCYYHLGDFKKAISTIDIAINLNPSEERLKTNKNFFLQNLNSK